MSAVVDIKWQGPDYEVGDTLAVDVYCLITGTADDIEVNLALEAQLPLAYAGAKLRGWTVDERLAHACWSAKATYVRERSTDQANPSDPATAYEFSFSTGGGSTKVTQSLSTVANYAESGTPPDYYGAIGVTKDTVEGCDVVIPTYSWKETHRFPAAAVNQAYRLIVAGLTGSVNSSEFRGFSGGEVLFLGADGSLSSARGEFSITYSFAAQKNANLTVGAMTGIAKDGWHYIWLRYREKEDAAANQLVLRPVSAHVEQVYPVADFAALGIGS
ncbi:MAG: hypothetical protein KF774_17755 [Planctomyces sp.]|nr:hypothetical protein [Planctomyces sp.]